MKLRMQQKRSLNQSDFYPSTFQIAAATSWRHFEINVEACKTAAAANLLEVEVQQTLILPSSVKLELYDCFLSECNRETRHHESKFMSFSLSPGRAPPSCELLLPSQLE